MMKRAMMLLLLPMPTTMRWRLVPNEVLLLKMWRERRGRSKQLSLRRRRRRRLTPHTKKGSQKIS